MITRISTLFSTLRQQLGFGRACLTPSQIEALIDQTRRAMQNDYAHDIRAEAMGPELLAVVALGLQGAGIDATLVSCQGLTAVVSGGQMVAGLPGQWHARYCEYALSVHGRLYTRYGRATRRECQWHTLGERPLSSIVVRWTEHEENRHARTTPSDFAQGHMQHALDQVLCERKHRALERATRTATGPARQPRL